MNESVLIILFALLCGLGLVIYYDHQKHESKSNFCQCNGLGGKTCPDPNKLKKLYAEGKLTETTIPQNGSPKQYHQLMMPYDAFIHAQYFKK